MANDTFDSFNGYILKGDAAQGLALMFDTLMARAMDEPDAVYGLVAKTADLAADRKSLVFELRPEAKFADGTKLTAEDVCDSFRLLSTLGHENIRLTIKDVEACDVVAPYDGALPLQERRHPRPAAEHRGLADFLQGLLRPA